MLATNEVLQQKRYRIIHQTAEDSTGAVYEAYDNVLETNVILKEIKINLERVTTAAQQETRKQAFAGEAKILTEIKHESIVHVCDYFSEIDRQYLVIESVSGHDLRELIEKDKNPIRLTDLASWADQLLDALHCLHTRTPPIIHGDIKPQNVKLAAGGKVKLLALSLPKAPDAKTNAIARSQASLAAGGLHFLALEQIWEGLDSASKKVILNSYDEKSEKILEQPADTQTDIYGIGATLYYLATAQLPTDALERSIDILEGKPDPLPAPADLNPKIPPKVSEVLMRALEIKRENRFGAASIMRQILRSAVGQAIAEAAVPARNRETGTVEFNPAKQNSPSLPPLPLQQQQSPPAGQQKSIEEEQKFAAQKKLEMEAEQKRQLELIEQQLRESEAQRLIAEERAAAAEKRLREKAAIASEDTEIINLGTEDILELENREILDADDKTQTTISLEEPVVEPELPPQPAAAAAAAADISSAAAETTDKPAASHQNSPDEFPNLFTEPAKDNKIFKRMSVAVVALLVFGGAGWGVWNSMASKPPVETNQAVSSSEPVKPVAAAAPVETTPAAPASTDQITAETSSEPALPPGTAEEEEEAAVVNDTVDPAGQKYKSPQLSSKAKKQTPTSAKTPAAQKKAVTVEDIINDN